MDYYDAESAALVESVLAGRADSATGRVRRLAGVDGSSCARLLAGLTAHAELAVRRWALDALTTPPLATRLAPSLAELPEARRVRRYALGRELIAGESAAQTDALLRVTRTGLRWQRSNALDAIGALRDPAALPTLIALLETPDPLWTAPAIASIAEYGAAAVSSLLPLLASELAIVRADACRLLGACGGPVKALLAALDDPARTVRSAAAEALGVLGDEAAVPALGAALADSDERTRGNAATALARFGRREFVPAIARLLRWPGDNSNRDYVKALGALGGDEAQAALLDVIARGMGGWLCVEAAIALEKVGDERALRALEGMLAGARMTYRKRDVRVAAEREIQWTIGVIRRRAAAQKSAVCEEPKADE